MPPIIIKANGKKVDMTFGTPFGIIILILTKWCKPKSWTTQNVFSVQTQQKNITKNYQNMSEKKEHVCIETYSFLLFSISFNIFS